MKKLYKILTAAVLGGAPFLAFAQMNIVTVEGLVSRLNSILAAIIPFIVALAVVVILWGVFNYIVGAVDEEKRGEAKQYVVWGIIGLFVMVSIWGLVNILEGTFTLKKDVLTTPGIPARVGSSCIQSVSATGVTTYGTLNNQGLCI
ncbi:MAG: Uncharacterized protein Greene041679_35 [Parcubacteria group bacterium Greene0416_79]|nr:MAG: Uncharacterized protein Greene041679_35 [Parcubacteria group bacterium Greene0416_79]